MRLSAAGVHDNTLSQSVRIPRFHGGPLVRHAEVGEHGVAGTNVLEIPFDDLRFVSNCATSEVAPEWIDGLPAGLANHCLSLPAVVVSLRRPGEVHAHRTYSTYMETEPRSTEFVALGHAGSAHYAGLETFPNPGVSQVEMTSDELTALCPVTGQPDLYTATIEYRPAELCLESKSLKLYLSGYRDEGHFCEALAVKIRDDVAEALELPVDRVFVRLTQKARGGITITASS
jgi:7-cyano-7-deazaguanine reductase